MRLEVGGDSSMAKVDLTRIRYEDINDQVRRYSHHAFLQSAQITPGASRFHFDVAVTVLQHGNVPLEEAVPILEAVLLLHRGLSIHEDVDMAVELKRQLNVLAGDYCSARYYWVIARTGNDKLIQALSDSVATINEAKMTLYREQGRLTADEYILLQETIHGDLLFTLGHVFLSDAALVMSQIQSAVRAYIVRQDVTETTLPRHFTLRQAFDWLSEAKEKLIPGGTAISPSASNVVLDSWNILRGLLDKQSLAEGKH